MKTKSIIAFCAVALMVMACSHGAKLERRAGSGREEAAQCSQAFEVKQLRADEMSKAGNCSMRVAVTMDYPVSGPAPLVDSVRAAMARYADVPVAVFADGPKAVACIQAGQAASLADDAAAWDDDDSGFPAPTLESSYAMRLKVNVPKYLVYDMDFYIYAGGAHGISAGNSVTFVKPSGHRVTDFFAPADYERVQQMVAQALAQQYFKCTMSELPEKITCNIDDISVAGDNVSLSGTGVVFRYQPYEISYYAAGAPECEIPFGQIKQLLLPQVRQLID